MEKLTSPLKQFAHFLIPWFLLALFFGQYGKHFLHSPFSQIGLCHKIRLKNWKTGNNLTQRHSGFFKNAFNRKVYFVTCMYFELALFLAEGSCTLMPYGQCPPPPCPGIIRGPVSPWPPRDQDRDSDMWRLSAILARHQTIAHPAL